jgi:S-adenosylmethionine hydrolase
VKVIKTPSTITLLTDFGMEDEYAGVVKGVILSVHPSARIIDLCHQVPPGDVVRAGWMLEWSWAFFPKGTVHVVIVDPGVGSSRRILCLVHEGHLFLAPDNGVLSRVVEDIPCPRVHRVSTRRYALSAISHTFHGRDIFAPLAGHLARGLPPHRLGPRVTDFKRLCLAHSVWRGEDLLTGEVITLDRFGNAVTNISGEQVARLGRQGRIAIKVKGHRIQAIQKSYSAVAVGSPLGVIGSHDLLEIAVNRGSASHDLHIKVGDPVQVMASKR